MKQIVINIHKQDMFDELIDSMKRSHQKYGDDKFKVVETEEQIIIDLIDRV